jgi:Raf kinase inhibitor-like YbhB/YbcL family protein
MIARATVPLLLLGLLAAGCGGGGQKTSSSLPAAPSGLRLASPAFPAGGRIPLRFTCDGADLSPPLRIGGVPARARELALVLEDPDAPGGTFVHWVLVHLPPDTRSLATGRAPPGALATRNSFGKAGYGGPCPPSGARPHRYVFAVYALSRRIVADRRSAPDRVLAAIRGAAVSQGRFTARYGR